MKYSDYEGHVFGRLLVRLDLGTVYNEKQTHKKRMVLAECLNCAGSVKSYIVASLKSGATKSCGCLQKEIASKRLHQHGKSNTSTYSVWKGMNHRCFDSNHPAYKHYGGRGITVCERWANSFENFLADMGERPTNSEIDRTDNQQGYSPDNCKWVSVSENRFNQRKRKDNTSGKTGVRWKKTIKKWVVEIAKNGKLYHLGNFENLDDAIQRRKQAELEFFGYTKE